MFDVAFVQSSLRRRICRDVAHVEVGVPRVYARQMAVIKEITLCLK